MPAPAVIPAPRAYINAAAVKGFVVEFGDRRYEVVLDQKPLLLRLLHVRNRSLVMRLGADRPSRKPYAKAVRRYYCEQNSVSKAGFARMIKHGITGDHT